jgi:hypothetical protein
MACLLGVPQSFVRVEIALAEVAGWERDDNTIRQLGHTIAAHANADRDQRTTAMAFAQAKGDLELPIDVGKVNTLEGGRDVKVGVFDRRQRGEPSTAAEWDERDLPAPSVRSVVAAVETSALFGERCVAEAERLGLSDPQQLNILGDGAEWVGNLAGNTSRERRSCWTSGMGRSMGPKVPSRCSVRAARPRRRKQPMAAGVCWRTATWA